MTLKTEEAKKKTKRPQVESQVWLKKSYFNHFSHLKLEKLSLTVYIHQQAKEIKKLRLLFLKLKEFLNLLEINLRIYLRKLKAENLKTLKNLRKFQ
jgi:hypothetical protein